MRSLKHINAYLSLHGKHVSKDAVDEFLSILQSDIKSGKITKAKDRFTKEVDRIQRSLVGMSNVMFPAEVAKVVIEPARKKHYERIITVAAGLGGILPIMLAGAVTGSVTAVTAYHIKKMLGANMGLSGLGGDISEAEKNKWIEIHTKQLEKAELDLEKANTKEAIREAEKQIKWLKGALKNAKALIISGVTGVSKLKKPSGTILSKDKAQKLCSDWHDGQNSALYQFASSKVFVPENFDKYIFEIESIQRHLATSTGKAYKDMQSLKKFFQYKNWELNNGVSGASEGVDLFEDHENIPKNVKKVLDKYPNVFENGDADYKICAKALKELEKIGYTYDYGLDGQPFDLRKIGEKGKSESISGIKTDEKKLRKSVKAKGIRLTHGYRLAKRKKGVTKKKKRNTKAKKVTQKVTPKKVAPKKAKKVAAKKENVLQKFIDIIEKSKNFESAFKTISAIKGVPKETSKMFSSKYNSEGKLSAKDAFKLFYNEVKGIKVAVDPIVKKEAPKTKKHSPGKAIAPKNNKVKASVTAAIADLLTLDKYKKYGAMFLGMFYSTFKNSDVVSGKIGDMKEKMFEKYEFDLFEHDYHANTIEITEKGKELIKSIEGRINTLKAKKSGTDLFPELGSTKGPKTISETVDQVLGAMKAERSGIKTVNAKKHNTHILPVYRQVEVMPVQNTPSPVTTSHVQTSTVKTEGTMSGAEMGQMTFEKLNFNDYYKGIFGSPATNFDMCIDGSPGSGKTTFLLIFGNYLADFHGPTLFVTTEEFGSATLIDKINRFNIKSKNIRFAKKVPEFDELKKYKFIFIDSINHAKITIEQYQAMREKAPKTAFILVLQQTKNGSYKGSTDWPHEVEITMSMFKNEFDERMLKINKDRYTDPVPRVVKI